MSCIVFIKVGIPRIKKAEMKIFTPIDLKLGGFLAMIVLKPKYTITRTIRTTTRSLITAFIIPCIPASSKKFNRLKESGINFSSEKQIAKSIFTTLHPNQ
jgi:hypothetical protein